MARYEQLQVRKDALYLTGAPITIEAEALLKDNKTKTLSAQVKFANVGHLSIDTVVAEYRPVAAMGRELEPVVYQYRCDGAAPGVEFGQTEPVKLPGETVEFSSRVLRVGFTNGGTWDAPEDSEWTKLPEQEGLAEAIGDRRLLDQYAISVGAGLTYVARELGSGSWACGCKAINGPGRTTCLSCHNSLANQLSHLDKDLLDREATKREEEEREEAERQAKLAAERAAKEAEEAERKRIEEERLAAEKEAQNKKAKKAFAIVCAIAALAAVAYFVISTVVIPSGKYNDAVALMESGDLAGAETAFAALGDYKDSQTKVKECQYSKAISLMEDGKYCSAKEAFEALGDFQDSSARAAECEESLTQEIDANANEVSELIKKGDFDAARNTAASTEVASPDEIYARGERKAIESAKVGDVVVYGKMTAGPQDNEPMEWQVLDVDDQGALLLVRNGLSMTAINDDNRNDDWSKTAIRKILQGGEGIDGIFTKPEQDGIDMREHVYDGEYDEATKSYKGGTEKSTKDKLFFLSRVDVEKYYPDPSSRLAKSVDGVAITWWLSDTDGSKAWPNDSSPTYTTMFCCVSRNDGSISSGREAFDGFWARPAMWVSFD